MDYRGLKLTFRKVANGNTREVRFRILDHALAQRWAARLVHLLKSDARLEKNYLLHGWLGGGRDLMFLSRELDRHIELINSAFAGNPGGFHHHIAMRFSGNAIDQNKLNLLHHHFEKLIGQVWSPSPYYLAVDERTRHSIRQLNNICHEMESYIRAEREFENGQCQALVVASFLPTGGRSMERLPLADADYEHFRLGRRFGDVYLHYAQLGKTHWEAFKDGDEIVGRDNISGLRYLTGEFDVHLSEPAEGAEFAEMCEDFRRWLTRHGFDPDDKRLALGCAVVARIEEEPFPRREFLSELFRFDDISSIAVESGSHTIAKSFEYTWQKDDLESLQLGPLSPWRKLASRVRALVARAPNPDRESLKQSPTMK